MADDRCLFDLLRVVLHHETFAPRKRRDAFGGACHHYQPLRVFLFHSFIRNVIGARSATGFLASLRPKQN